MKRILLGVVVAALFLISTAANAAIDTLTILHVNDTHSHLLPYGPRDGEGNHMWGGWARLATLIGMNEITCPNALKFHSGDFFVGDFMFQEYVGVAELEIMKALNFDALELGNHEFDLYPSTLKYVLNQAGFPSSGFPVLCANLDISGDPEMAYFVSPYTIKEFGDFKVGIFGLLTDLTNQISNPSPVSVISPYAVAQGWVDSLRTGLGCDAVILISHMGTDYDQMIAATTSGIDIIIGGHSHTTITEPLHIGNTIVVQAGEFGKYLGKTTAIFDNGAFVSWEYALIPVDQAVPEEPSLAGMINYLAAGVEADPRFGPVYSEVISTAAGDIEKPLHDGFCRDNGLGNLIADAIRQQAGTDIAFHPQGFCSQSIYAGPLVGNDIFQAMPYGFDPVSGLGLKIATFETDGMSIMAGLEFAVYNLPYMEDFFLHVSSNFSFNYNSANAQGSRIDYSSIRINGLPLNPFGTYSVGVPDGVVPFLSQIPGFQVNNLTITEDFIYSVMANLITANSPISYYSEGRILDMAPMADPIAGTAAFSDVVTLFQANGSISRSWIAPMLLHKLDMVSWYLARGYNSHAIRVLRFFKMVVNDQYHHGGINALAFERLMYLADALIDSISNSPQLARGEVADDTDLQPHAFELTQNYPNPFNPQTEISYSLPDDGDVRLVIYDILGQEIVSLVDGYESAGIKTVIWDGKDSSGNDVASGVYIYHLVTESGKLARKMTLIR